MGTALVAADIVNVNSLHGLVNEIASARHCSIGFGELWLHLANHGID